MGSVPKDPLSPERPLYDTGSQVHGETHKWWRHCQRRGEEAVLILADNCSWLGLVNSVSNHSDTVTPIETFVSQLTQALNTTYLANPLVEVWSTGHWTTVCFYCIALTYGLKTN